MSDEKELKAFGSKTAWSEPLWYDPKNPSPYYGDAHIAFRNKIRAFMNKEVMPNIAKWEGGNNTIPLSVYKAAFECGLLPAICGWPEDVPGIPPRPEGFDHFFSIIAQDEVSRSGSGGVVWGLVGAMGIGIPPVVHYGSDEMKERVVGPCIRGEKRICLAVSEPTAGSDVGSIKTTAIEKDDYYLLNGLKKWITGGLFADFYTVAAQTSPGSGMGGVELFLVEKTFPGVSVRPMECMGAKGSGTAYVEFADVKVPKKNKIGGVFVLLQNFVSERIGIAVQATRFARVCLAKSIERTKRRKAFGKKLISQPVVRAKLANMARLVTGLQAWIDNIVYRAVQADKNGEDTFSLMQRLGPEAMLLKVQGAKVFEQCARDAAHLHGGDSYVKGNRVESLYRHVLSLAIPGGSEDVMIDAAGKMSLTKSRM